MVSEKGSHMCIILDSSFRLNQLDPDRNLAFFTLHQVLGMGTTPWLLRAKQHSKYSSAAHTHTNTTHNLTNNQDQPR